MSKIKIVVFDMAGTTVKDENEVEKCFVEAAERSELKYTREEIISMMGWPKIKVFETLWTKMLNGKPKEVIGEKVEYSYMLFREILEKHYMTEDVVPIEGTMELFQWLKSNDIKIVLTTGFYRKVTDIILQRLGWNKGLNSNYANGTIIDASITSDMVTNGRPAPDMIFRAMEMYNITNPKQVIKIGDTPSDLQSGKNAGCCLSLGVTYGTHTKEQLSEYPNDGLINNILEIKQLISKQNETFSKCIYF